MADLYKVIGTQPWIYSDEFGRVVHGFKVFVLLPEFGETHELMVPKLDAALVKTKATELAGQRKALAG